MRRHGRIHVLVILLFIGFQGLTWVSCSQPEPPRIGVVNLTPRLDPVLDALKEGMADLGYVEGENIVYVYAGPAESIDALDGQVEMLLDAEVKLIISLSTPATQAAHRLTQASGLPVVFGPVTDPVAAGVVDNVAQPGGNITGVRLGRESEAERLEWLKRAVPTMQQIYIPYNPEDDSAISSVTAVSEAAEKLGITVTLREARNNEEISTAIADIPEDTDALLLPQDSLVATRIDDFVAAAIDRQLPLSSPTDEQVTRGAFISYSFRLHELGLQMARLVDQILQGADPAHLPVETAQFFLTVNLKTAEEIHIDVPDIVLQSAHTIIRD